MPKQQDEQPPKRATAKRAAAKRAPAKKGRNGTNKLTAAKKVERDAKVIALRAKGRSWTEVGKEVGMHPDHCQVIWRHFVEQGKLRIQQTDPAAVVFDQITRLDSDIDMLAGLADDGDSTAAQVAAIRAKAALMQQQAELLQAVGLMPKNLGSVRVDLEIRYVVQMMLSLLENVAKQEMTLEEAEDKLLALTASSMPQPLQIVDASAN